MIKFQKVILISIIILSAVLRLWNLGSVPPSASLDEASISYNAYSILKTGADEYGEHPILSHRAYDDWRRATYLYLSIPSVAVFGLNPLSIRLPAVILSILTVWATYAIVLHLFKKPSSFSYTVALLSALLLAISPWHIYISRVGHESNACLSFLVFAIYFFLKGEKSKKWIFLIISILFFVLSLVSYYSGQAFIPLFGLGLLIIFRKSILTMISSNKKILAVLAIILLLIMLLLKEVFSPSALVRFQGTSTFKPEAHGELFAQRVELRNKAVVEGDFLGSVINNQRLFLVQVFIQGYAAHLNPNWLFFNSSKEPFKVPNLGLLYLWQIPFIAIGFFTLLFSSSVDGRVKKLIFLWFFLSPIPGAIATQAPHAMRSFSIVAVWQLFTAFGLAFIFFGFPKFKILTALIFATVITYNLWTFYHNYFIVFPKEQSKSFQYALSQAVPYILSEQKNHKRVVFANTGNLYQSYMLFLYHSKYDPAMYQKFGGTKSGGFAESHTFDKYEFKSVDLTKEPLMNGVLYVINASDVSSNKFTDKTFRNLDGSEAIKVISK